MPLKRRQGRADNRRMEDLWWIIASGVGLLLLGAGATWRVNRARLARMKRKLAWAEESRFAAELHAKVADARLADATQKLAARKPHSPGTAPPGRHKPEPLSMPTSNPSGLAVQWADTEPIAVDLDGFKPTQPFEPTRR